MDFDRVEVVEVTFDRRFTTRVLKLDVIQAGFRRVGKVQTSEPGTPSAIIRPPTSTSIRALSSLTTVPGSITNRAPDRATN